MESAIPKNLECPRTRARRVADSYVPPYPAYTARAHPALERVVMGYFGVQASGPGAQSKSQAALTTIVRGFADSDGPGHHDLVHFVDAAGYDNRIAIAYWRDPAAFARWRTHTDVWWRADERSHEDIGFFREIISPRVEHFETLYNSVDRLEGVGAVMGGVSQEIQEHAYWGAARDRLPLAQIDALEPSRPRTLLENEGARMWPPASGHSNRHRDT